MATNNEYTEREVKGKAATEQHTLPLRKIGAQPTSGELKHEKWRGIVCVRHETVKGEKDDAR